MLKFSGFSDLTSCLAWGKTHEEAAWRKTQRQATERRTRSAQFVPCSSRTNELDALVAHSRGEGALMHRDALRTEIPAHECEETLK
jgi:hypothetical protein